MLILTYANDCQAMFCEERLVDGGYSGLTRNRVRPRKKTNKNKASVLQAGFEKHTVTMPDGCKVTLHEDGQIFVQEENETTPKKVRFERSQQKNIIK